MFKRINRLLSIIPGVDDGTTAAFAASFTKTDQQSGSRDTKGRNIKQSEYWVLFIHLSMLNRPFYSCYLALMAGSEAAGDLVLIDKTRQDFIYINKIHNIKTWHSK